MTSLTGYDSIVNNIPADAAAAFGYTSGNWPTYDEAWFKALKAKYKRSIAVNVQHRAFFLDVEPGDATAAEASGWYSDVMGAKKSMGADFVKPGYYTSLSNVLALMNTLKAHGIARDDYVLWTAHYTFKAHLCSPACGFGMPTVADGTQYTDKANGKNLDASFIHVESMFPTAAKPQASPYDIFYDQKLAVASAHPTAPKGMVIHLNERETVQAFDEAMKHPLSPSMAHTESLIYDVLSLRKHVWKVAHDEPIKGKPGWSKDRRGSRWQALDHRTEGL